MSDAFIITAERNMQEIVDRGGRDPELDHMNADEILRLAAEHVGLMRLCNIYAQVTKWYA